MTDGRLNRLSVQAAETSDSDARLDRLSALVAESSDSDARLDRLSVLVAVAIPFARVTRESVSVAIQTDSDARVTRVSTNVALETSDYDTATLIVDLLDASATLYEPTVNHGLLVPLLDAAPAPYEPTVAPGSVTLIFDTLDASPTPYEPALNHGLTAPLLDASPTLHEPTLTASYTINVPHIAEIRSDFRWVTNSAMIVHDPTDPAYADTPLPPEGAVFRNYRPQTDTWPNTNLYAADMLELLVTMVTEYEASSAQTSLDVATLLTGHAITSMKTGLTSYTYPLTMIAERYTYSGGWNKAEGVGAEYHIRTTLLAAYALLRMYKHDTADYSGKDLSEWALELLDTGRRMQQFSDDRADGSDLPTWMAGSMSEWWNEGATNTTPHWSYHPMFLGDVVWKAYTEAIDQLGDTQNRRDAGTYLLSDVRDDYMTWVDDAIDSHSGLMSDTDSGYVDLPYQRFHCPGDGTGSAMNIYHPQSSTPSATADWTSDSMFWIVEGLARASNSKADTYVSDLEDMRHGSPLRYYDSYTVSGGATTSPAAADDVTQASALNARVSYVLGDPVDLTWIEASQISEADPVSDGAWTWVGDNSPPIHYVESIATAVCLWALLTDADPDDISGTQVFAPTLSVSIELEIIDVSATLYEPTLAKGVTVSLLDASATLYEPTLDLAIFIPLIDASATLHGPNVSASAIIATPPLSVGTIYEPNIASTQYVELDLLNVAAAPHEPSVIAGDGNIFAELLSVAATLHEPTLSASIDVPIPLLEATATVSEPALSASYDIVAPLLSAAPTLYEPSVTISVIVPILSAAPNLHEPTVDVTAYVTLDIIDASATLQEPTIARGAVTLLIPVWNVSTVVYDSGVTSAGQIVVPLLDSSAIPHEPTLATIVTVPAVAAGTIVEGPAVTSTIDAPIDHLDASPTLYNPALALATAVPIDHLDASATLHEPTIPPPAATAGVPLLGPFTNVHNPTVIPPALPFETSGRWGMLPIGLSSP